MNQPIIVEGVDGQSVHLVVTVKALSAGDLPLSTKPDPVPSTPVRQGTTAKEPMTDSQRQLIRRLLPKRFRDLSIRNLEMERIKWFGKADASRYITELLQA